MPRCPECRKIIDCLKYYESQSGSAMGRAYLRHNSLDYEEDDHDVDNSEVTNFNCPECGCEIVTHEGEAIDFLRGSEEELEEKSSGIFLCEKHNIKFTTECEKCLSKEKEISNEH